MRQLVSEVRWIEFWNKLLDKGLNCAPHKKKMESQQMMELLLKEMRAGQEQVMQQLLANQAKTDKIWANGKATQEV
jgi:hypothetical protein